MTDDETIQRPARVPSLLQYESKASGMTTSHTRSKSKLANVHVRATTVARVDVGAELKCVRILVAQLSRGEFECWLALKEGILFDPIPRYVRGVTHGAWRVVPPPAKSASVEETARHYRYTEGSVKRMDQQARKLLTEIRENAGLIGGDIRIPIWPVVKNDAELLEWLYQRPW